jgi:DNA-binding NtrC family response regulator
VDGTNLAWDVATPEPALAVVTGGSPDLEPLAHGLRAVRELLEATDCVLFWMLPQGLSFRAAHGQGSARLARDLDHVAAALDERVQGPCALVPSGRLRGELEGLAAVDAPLPETVVLAERVHRRLALGLAVGPCGLGIAASQIRFAHAVFRDMARLLRSQNVQPDAVSRRNGRWQKHQFAGLIGASRCMQRLFRTIEKLAQSDVNVLLSGESGTGKELVARAIHDSGMFAGHKFVAQNCAALPESLLESELFGHCRGAFTGANFDKRGLFEEANTGTFFLDEIADMPIPLQIKMLRVLQEGEIRRLGETRTRRVQVRIVAATNKRLPEEVAEGRFRSDLFFRLNVVRIDLAPLRRRRDDVPLLARFFCDRTSARLGRPPFEFSDEVLQRFVEHDWPGNVRELENEIERLVALYGDEGVVRPYMLSETLRYGSGSDLSLDRLEEMRDLNQASEYLERAMIGRSLDRHAWNKSRAANELGVSRQGLIKKIQRLRLVRPAPLQAAAAPGTEAFDGAEAEPAAGSETANDTHAVVGAAV